MPRLAAALTRRYQIADNPAGCPLARGPVVMRFFRIFCVSGMTLALFGCATANRSTQFGGLPPTTFPVHGIDVSKYQGLVDWSQVRDSGVQFAWIKATEGGDNIDDRFADNWNGAAAAGIPRGAYHFVYWCRSPAEQMANFERNVPVDDSALPPVLDVELTPTSPTCKRTLYREPVLAEMRQMLEEMERHYGKKPVIYSTVDFYAGILAGGGLSDYPIWVRSTKYHPSVKYPGRKWHFWQYQSDGRIDGIQGKVDRNAFFGSPDQWMAFVKDGSLPLD